VFTDIYRSLSIALIVLSKDDWEFYDSEWLVILFSLGGESCWGGDVLTVKDWGGTKDWVDGEGILIGDDGCWIFVWGFRCW